MTKKELHKALRQKGRRQWELAAEMGIGETTLVKWLRADLTGEHLDRVTEALDRLTEREGF